MFSFFDATPVIFGSSPSSFVHAFLHCILKTSKHTEHSFSWVALHTLSPHRHFNLHLWNAPFISSFFKCFSFLHLSASSSAFSHSFISFLTSVDFSDPCILVRVLFFNLVGAIHLKGIRPGTFSNSGVVSDNCAICSKLCFSFRQ